MTYESRPGDHGLAPCRACQRAVAPPPALLGRQFFHLPTCPHCGARCPHPEDQIELRETLRMASLAGVLLVVALVALQFGDICDMVTRRLA